MNSSGQTFADDAHDVSHRSNVNGSLVLVGVREDLIVDEEPSESEFVESVERFACIAVEVERIGCGAANFVRIDGVKVRCVGGMIDFGNIWRFLLSQIGLEVDALEERVHLDFVRILAESPFGRRAKAEDEVGRFSRQIRLDWDVQTRFVVDDLNNGGGEEEIME